MHGNFIDASRLFIYKATRDLLGWTGDTGAYLRSTMEALVLLGAPPERYWTYDTTQFDAEPPAALAKSGLRVFLRGEWCRSIQTGYTRHLMGLRIHPSVFPKPGFDEVVTRTDETRTVVLAGGLFWCADALYRAINGIVSVRPGYSGGPKANANFEAVSGGHTDHLFVVELVYEPAKLAFGQILQVFFSIAHDPTLHDRKGFEPTRAYRSAIYYTTPVQRATALDYIARLKQAGVFDSLILTDVSPLSSFFEAEPLHHDYVAKHPRNHHVRMVSLPKLSKLKKLYPQLLKPAP